MYFKKILEDSMIITSIDSESSIIKLSGDYINMWSLIESDSDEVSFDLDNLGPELHFLKDFLVFLKENHFSINLTPQIAQQLVRDFSRPLTGTFDLVSFGLNSDSAFEVFATRGSLYGTDAYGGAETCESPNGKAACE